MALAIVLGMIFAVGGLADERVWVAADSAPDAFRDCERCPEMVVVPPGIFIMGSEDSVAEGSESSRPMGPPREVSIPQAFALGKYEVTNAQYQAFVNAAGHEMAPGCRGRDPEEVRYSFFGFRVARSLAEPSN